MLLAERAVSAIDWTVDEQIPAALHTKSCQCLFANFQRIMM
jgi:hypothetical protein